eukprot:c8979_g1_i1.p1 GENE.c8979_g1_i1~~c8979_g1_i1.p1  ORF type:complete len:154 (+),score=20.74 c8979_g1_i1:67-462(+)
MTHNTCAHCRTNLMYPVGKSCVKCGKCDQINTFVPAQMLQMKCYICSATLVFPQGCPSIKCICNTIITFVPPIIQRQMEPASSTQIPLSQTAVTPSKPLITEQTNPDHNKGIGEGSHIAAPVSVPLNLVPQ